MNLSLDTSFVDEETLLVLSVQSFIKSKASTASIDVLLKQHQQSKWSLSLIHRFLTFIRADLEELRNVNDVLHLVSHLIDGNNWSADGDTDMLIYSTMVYEEDSENGVFSLLTILTDMMLNGSAAAMIVVSKIWQALERLQCTTIRWSQDNPNKDAWWIDAAANPTEWTALTQTAIATIMDSGSSQQPPDDVYCAHVSILTNLLQFDVCDWITPLKSKNRVKQLTDTLLLDVSIWQLQQPAPPSTQQLRRGLLSMRLLSLIPMHLAPSIDDDDMLSFTQDFDNMANSSSLVEHVLQVAFPVDNTNSTSSQTALLQFSGDTMTQLRPDAMAVIQSWSIANGETWAHVLSLERQWGNFLSQSWSALINGDNSSCQALPGMLTLHQLCPMQARSTIEMVTKHYNSQQEATQTFAERLLALCCSHEDSNVHVATCAAALFRLLLGNRRDKLQNDVSRGAWEALERHKDAVLSLAMTLASSQKAAHSLLVVMLDILDLAVRHIDSYAASMGTKEVELLIDLMMNNNPAAGEMFGDDMDVDEETPQFHNLSRIMDESHLDITAISSTDNTKEQKEPASPRGMDATIAIAAATVVARYGATRQTSSVLDSRIQRVIHDYVDGFNIRCDASSFDLHHRHFRLQMLAASSTDDDEIMIATTQWKHLELHLHELTTKDDEVAQYQKQIEQLNQRMQALLTEKRQVELSVKSQAVLFQRQLNKSRKAARIETSRLVEHHVAERSKAENRVTIAMKRVGLAESKQEEAEQLVEKYRASESQAREALRAERSKVLDAERVVREKEVSDQKKDGEIRSLRLNLEEANNQVAEKADQVVSTLKQLEEKELHLKQSSEAFTDVREELESAYEKLVALAQIYEIKEEETEEATRKADRDVRNTKRKLENEIRRNDELEEDNLKLQRDTDRLAKKLERAKERMAHDLQERTEEKERRKRNGPISYINQLHNTSNNESQRSSGVSSKDRSRLFTGKENTSYYSSSSRSRGRSYNDR